MAYQDIGHGAFVGMWAAPLCHLLWGGNLLILPFAYGFGMSRLRSWQELAALLSMLGTTVAYFCVYDVVAVDDLSLVPTLALAVLVVVLLFIFWGVVGARVEAAGLRAWTHAQSFPRTWSGRSGGRRSTSGESVGSTASTNGLRADGSAGGAFDSCWR